MKRPAPLAMFTDARGYSGAEEAMVTLLAGLDRSRFDPTLVHHADGTQELARLCADLGVRTWVVPRMPEGLSGAAAAVRFASALRSRRPAIFHAHLPWQLAAKYPLAAAVAAEVPVVLATVQLYVDVRPTLPTLVQQRLLARSISRYVAVSGHVRSRLSQLLALPQRRIATIENAVDAGRFGSSADPALRDRLARGARYLVLTLARLEEQKGLAHLVDAVRDVPETRFVIAGEGRQRAALEARIAAAGLSDRVELLGNRSDVPELLAASDLVVLPSLAEGLPISVLEAMAAGRPVLATAIGGTDEVVDPGVTGVLVPPGDPGALAAATRDLLGDEATRSRYAEAGMRCVRTRFTASRMVAEVEHLYDELLEERHVA